MGPIRHRIPVTGRRSIHDCVILVKKVLTLVFTSLFNGLPPYLENRATPPWPAIPGGRSIWTTVARCHRPTVPSKSDKHGERANVSRCAMWWRSTLRRTNELRQNVPTATHCRDFGPAFGSVLHRATVSPCHRANCGLFTCLELSH